MSLANDPARKSGGDAASKPHSPLLVKGLLVLAWIFALDVILKHLHLQFYAPGVDYTKHWVAAVEMLHGRSPYLGWNYLGFNYPLFTGWIYLWLGWLPEKTGENVWDVLNSLYVVATIAIVISLYRPKLHCLMGEDLTSSRPDLLSIGVANSLIKHWPTLTIFLVGCYSPIFNDIHCSNIEPLNLVLVTLLGAAVCGGGIGNRTDRTDKTDGMGSGKRAGMRECLAGIALTCVCLIKMLPVLFLPALFFCGRRRILITFAVLIGAYAAILFGSSLFLPEGWWRWEWFLYTKTLPHIGYQYREISSSLVAIASTTFWPGLYHSKLNYDLAAKVVSVSVGLIFLGVLFIGRHHLRTHWRDAFIFADLTIIVASPLVEYHHLDYCFPALILLVVDFLERRVRIDYFVYAAGLWAIVAFCAYWQDLGVAPPIHPRHVAVLAIAGLWLMTGGRIVCRSN